MKRDGLSQCRKLKALVTSSLYPSHESDEGVTSSKGVDYEGILAPDDNEDVCGRCWDFQHAGCVYKQWCTLC